MLLLVFSSVCDAVVESAVLTLVTELKQVVIDAATAHLGSRLIACTATGARARRILYKYSISIPQKKTATIIYIFERTF